MRLDDSLDVTTGGDASDCVDPFPKSDQPPPQARPAVRTAWSPPRWTAPLRSACPAPSTSSRRPPFGSFRFFHWPCRTRQRAPLTTVAAVVAGQVQPARATERTTVFSFSVRFFLFGCGGFFCFLVCARSDQRPCSAVPGRRAGAPNCRTHINGHKRTPLECSGSRQKTTRSFCGDRLLDDSF